MLIQLESLKTLIPHYFSIIQYYAKIHRIRTLIFISSTKETNKQKKTHTYTHTTHTPHTHTHTNTHTHTHTHSHTHTNNIYFGKKQYLLGIFGKQ